MSSQTTEFSRKIDQICEFFKPCDYAEPDYVLRNKSRIIPPIQELFEAGLLSADYSRHSYHQLSDLSGGEATLSKIVENNEYDSNLNENKEYIGSNFKALRRKELGFTDNRIEDLRELQAYSRIRHPNVIAVEKIFFEHNTQSDKLFLYVVMPWIDDTLESWLVGCKNRDFSQLVPKGNLKIKRSFEEIRQVMAQILMGIAAIHSNLVIHMDLKLNNILVEQKRVQNHE